MAYFNDWTREDYNIEIYNALQEGVDIVELDTISSSWQCEDRLKEWAFEDGYRAEIRESHVAVFLKERGWTLFSLN